MGIIITDPTADLDLAMLASLISPEIVLYERNPSVGIVRLISKARTPRKFTGLVHSLDFGSVTLALRINGSPIPGLGPLVPGTTPFRAVPSGGNILPIDGMLELVLTRATNPRGLSLQFEYDWVV
jgi:hypothetical protein